MINGERLQQRLEQLTVARHADAQGPTPDVPGWMATTAQTRTAQHKRYCQAQDHLALLQAANQRRSPSERRPLDKIVVSTGDPEAALGVDKDHVFRPLYTMQTIRDVDSPLILSYDVFAQATDAGTLLPMRARTEQLTGRRLQEVLVDSGYVTGVDLAVCAAESVWLCGPWKENDLSVSQESTLFTKEQLQWVPEQDAYRCPAGQLLKQSGREKRLRSGGREEVLLRYKGRRRRATRAHCGRNAPRAKGGRSLRRSEHEDLIVAHRAWMETAEAQRCIGYAVRQSKSSLQISKNIEAYVFSSRGLVRVRTELALEVLVHNLLVVHRSSSQQQTQRRHIPHANP